MSLPDVIFPALPDVCGATCSFGWPSACLGYITGSLTGPFRHQTQIHATYRLSAFRCRSASMLDSTPETSGFGILRGPGAAAMRVSVGDVTA